MTITYLDNNATTRVDPAVLEEMLPFFCQTYGNPSSAHGPGNQAARALAQARERVASALGCHPDEIVFTAGGSESDNAAIRSALRSRPDKRHLLTTRVEHPAVLNLARELESQGYAITRLGVDADGRLDLDEYRDSLRPDTALVSVMYANNETGVLFPVYELASIARERGILFHTDAVQAVGKVGCNLLRLPADFLALSGHKLHAPKGVGALFVRRGVPLHPLIVGGGQEHGRRAGTENMAGIVGLGKAMELAACAMTDEAARLAALRDRLETTLLASIPDACRNGAAEPRLPNTASLAFRHVDGAAVLRQLDQLGICASAGAACAAGGLKVSSVLAAMGLPLDQARGTIRFSLGRFSTADDVDIVLRELPPMVARLRRDQPGCGLPGAAGCTGN